MEQLAFRALMLGLSSGASCLGFCLPVALPTLAGSHRTGFKATALNLATFLLGRLSAYLLSGLIFGLLGSTIARFTIFHRLILPFLYIVLAILLILYGITDLNPFARYAFCQLIISRTESRLFPFLLGIMIGFSPCPPFLLAITTVTDIGGIKNGILFFFLFFLTTSLFFSPLLLIGIFNRYATVRLASRILAVITGFYFITIGFRLF
ncbi:MAG: sulfite exporter TauE/SafE family protein [candidate division WOR-3 bacterium]|jgi:sulfite exporter TauE/SafE|nr:sulfite exporter TauE/SafE family protein [candidate division WOR-3 bacterium]MDH7518933.1 sulfite exporter TauE/SafE family protein [bacterium]